MNHRKSSIIVGLLVGVFIVITFVFFLTRAITGSLQQETFENEISARNAEIYANETSRGTPDYAPPADILLDYVPWEYGVVFSRASGFYAEPFYLRLISAEGAEIFFTLDGSEPTTAATRFAEPIFIDAPTPAPGVAYFAEHETISSVGVFSVRAIAVLDDEISEPVTQNFVMGTDVFTRFCENTLIFALNSDPHGLFDHYDGIFIEGIDREIFRQEYLAEHGRIPSPSNSYGVGESPVSPANFNRRGRESERAVHVEMFDHTGVLHISQRAGMRVRGGFTRASEPQKSVELYARREYGDQHNFYFAFFDDEFTADGNLIERYRRVRLRNGGSDRNAGFIRDELGQSLFRQAGHSVTQTHRPAAVFLNGEYYGVAWLKSPRTENHLSRIFGGNSDRFEIVSGGDRRFEPSWWAGEERATTDLQEVVELARPGFAGEGGQARFEEFSHRMDVDALIRYLAMQIYGNNYDWPNHNLEMWRYFPTEREQNDPTLHPYLRDGRWRVFVHDVEASWAIWDDYGIMQAEDTLYDILTGTNHRRWNSAHSSSFLYAVVSRDDTRAQLANTFVDLIEGAFSPENVIATLDRLSSQIENEHDYAMKLGAFHPNNMWWPSPYSVEEYSREAIRRFAHARPDVILESVYNNLGFHRDERFTVTLAVNTGGTAIMNSRPVPGDETVAGNYFYGTSVRIKAIPNDGYTFGYFLVDGIRNTSEVITVSEDVHVELNFLCTEDRP